VSRDTYLLILNIYILKKKRYRIFIGYFIGFSDIVIVLKRVIFGHTASNTRLAARRLIQSTSLGYVMDGMAFQCLVAKVACPASAISGYAT